MRLALADYIYLLACCAAAIWQAWCFDSYKTAWLIVPLGLPFALASYVHAFALDRTLPDWRRAIVLWVGMPVSVFAAGLAMAVETGGMYAAGLGLDNLPFSTVRFLIGESVACLVWAGCLLLWCKRPLRNRFLVVFAFLYAGVCLSYGLARALQSAGSANIYFLLVSIIETLISAVCLILLDRAIQRN
jgi:hypothetical protein